MFGLGARLFVELPPGRELTNLAAASFPEGTTLHGLRWKPHRLHRPIDPALRGGGRGDLNHRFHRLHRFEGDGGFGLDLGHEFDVEKM